QHRPLICNASRWQRTPSILQGGEELTMKDLALLKDSFREALDTKVVYVMIILSAIVVVLVACIGFTPEPVTSLSQRFTIRPLNTDPQELKKFPLGLPDEMLPLDPGPYALVAVKPDNGAADRPNS